MYKYAVKLAEYNWVALVGESEGVALDYVGKKHRTLFLEREFALAVLALVSGQWPDAVLVKVS